MTACAGAAHATASHVVESGFVIARLHPKLGGGGVALHAVLVRIGLFHVDRALGLIDRDRAVTAEVVVVNVPHAAHLGDDRAVHSVVGVADVAVLFSEERVARMTRREREALGIVGVERVRRHHVARAAKARSFVASKPTTFPASAVPIGNTPSPSSSHSLVAPTRRGRRTR